ncbi:MAG: hypothetical protein M3539_04775, partial [Acidobacteriota bacterium]|nr:hypothetical protein [Acidobacteriota bacterium]
YYCVFEYERARSLLKRWKPQLYVTSADHWPFLPHIAAARDLNITTLSTESGLSFLRDNFAQKQADVICVFGATDAGRVANSRPEATIIQSGDALAPGRGSASSREDGPKRALFVMSGRMFGWWFGSLLFNYPVFIQALEMCAKLIRALPQPIQIVLKSHPVSDLHELYDGLVARHGDVFVAHRKEPMSEAEIAGFDAGVIFSAATAFTAELIQARVPLVYFSGGLTEFGLDYFDFKGLQQAATSEELVERLNELLVDAASRQEALSLGEAYLNRYVAAARRSFASVVGEVLGVDHLASLNPLATSGNRVGDSSKYVECLQSK